MKTENLEVNLEEAVVIGVALRNLYKDLPEFPSLRTLLLKNDIVVRKLKDE